ncbi:liguleless related sequence1 [Zea mays]|uniref:Liguleless related sequence1 n=1 Tax=Zea mays TaxID=4577 RepID=A0A1D6G814_MAIZE|nr:liguleless related sequence1 [Zea mays]
MVQGEESSWRMERAALPLNQALAYGVQAHGAGGAAAAPPTCFLDFHQPAAAAAAYFGFGELEEALIHGGGGGVDPGVITKNDVAQAKSAAGYLAGAAARPPTLEIFPSLPMRHQQQLHSGNSQSVGSTTDSSSAQNAMSQMELASPAASSAPRQEAMMVTADGYSYKPGLAAAAAGAAPPSFQFQQQHQHHHPLPLHGDGGGDHDKTERRLAQNREAARKSRLRKKAYVQQLETTRIRLQHVEHEFQRARSHSQGVGVGGCGAAGDMSCGAAMFDMEYARWLDDDSKRLAELRGGLQAHLLLDANLGLIVEECMQHHDELFQLKAALARSDVFHLLTGSWTTPAERCFFWMGGFRPSELLKVLIPQLDPLTEQQLLGICSLQQSSEQAEEALAQGLHQLHQALADTVAAGTLNEGSAAPNCMNIMAVALDKIASLENFYQQADNLRQQTLHQMRRILTTRQAARCFLSIGEYYSRLRALSNLWASRPGDTFIRSESLSPTATELQALHHQRQNQFSGF